MADRVLSVGVRAKAEAFAKYGGDLLGSVKPADGQLDYTKMPDGTDAQLLARKAAKTKHDKWVFGLPTFPAADVADWRKARLALLPTTGVVSLRNAALYLMVQEAQVRSWAGVNGLTIKDGEIAVVDVRSIENRRAALDEFVTNWDKENTVDDTGDRAAKANAAKYDAVMAGFTMAGFTPSAEVIAALKAQYGVS